MPLTACTARRTATIASSWSKVMGHRAGWLTLGAGIAGGADMVLIPEIPYDVESMAEAIRERARGGKFFSIVAMAEGAVSKQELEKLATVAATEKTRKTKEDKDKDRERNNHKGVGKERDEEVDDGAAKLQYADRTLHLAKQLENLTGLEARVTILGHLQRGGTPSAADRILATRLGTACADLIAQGTFGVMVAAKGEGTRPVPLEEVAGPVKTVPKDHPWILTARRVGTNLGD